MVLLKRHVDTGLFDGCESIADKVRLRNSSVRVL